MATTYGEAVNDPTTRLGKAAADHAAYISARRDWTEEQWLAHYQQVMDAEARALAWALTKIAC